MINQPSFTRMVLHVAKFVLEIDSDRQLLKYHNLFLREDVLDTLKVIGQCLGSLFSERLVFLGQQFRVVFYRPTFNCLDDRIIELLFAFLLHGRRGAEKGGVK